MIINQQADDKVIFGYERLNCYHLSGSYNHNNTYFEKSQTVLKTLSTHVMNSPLFSDLSSAMMMIGKFGPKMPPEHLPKNVAISCVVHIRKT